MNILQVCNHFPPSSLGGVEVYTYHLSRGLLRNGHTVHVFCRTSDVNRPDYELIEEEFEDIHVIRVNNNFQNLTDFTGTYMDEKIDVIFSNALKNISPDLVHFHHTIGLSARLPLISREHALPGLYTLHDFWPICHRVNLFNRERQVCPGPHQGGNCRDCVFGPGKSSMLTNLLIMGKKITSPALRRKVRQVLRSSDNQTPIVHTDPTVDDFETRYELFKDSLLSTQKLLSPSEFVKKQFTENGYNSEGIEVIPLSTDVPGSTSEDNIGGKPEKMTFAYIGSVIENKGADVLVRAFRRVPGKNLALHIYGFDKTDRSAFRKKIEALTDTDSRIRLYGTFNPEDKRDIFNEIDILVIPSRVPETFSLVAREALSVGVPVIASKVGAIPEVIKDGRNGFLFEAGNIDQLSFILDRIREHPEILDKLELPGLVQVATDEEHIKELTRIYTSTLTDFQPEREGNN